MSILDPDLRARAEAWAHDDPSPRDAEALRALVSRADDGDQEAAAELASAFSGPLEFGTAGLRGRMGPGETRMNLAVVSRAARGLADHLLGLLGGAGTDEAPLVVIGHDARYHSREFAERSAQILVAAGCRVQLMDRYCPTPLVAFGVRRFDADAGIVVTASHNPPADNGYKVYLGGRAADDNGKGVQIVPPSDAQIAERIAAVGSVGQIPLADSGWETIGDDLREEYLREITALVRDGAPADLRIVHTAMHGVGTELAVAALHRVGFTDVHSVAKQAEPDPDFPTVAFPNPEEKGAIDLALELARTVDADLVIANDPDADRCAAAVFDPHRNSWRMLTGDELGVLLGMHMLTVHGADGVFANSVVSSRWLGKAAQAAGHEAATTLTGFKWIARTDRIVYGYEEAIGYCVAPHLVRDKDGLSAALMIAEAAALAKSEGRTLVDLLDDLARQHGLHATGQLSLRVEDLSLIGEMMQRLRQDPPQVLAGERVVEIQDLACGSLETTGLPPTDGVLLRTEGDSRVIVRPSGTEPKLKCYLEVIERIEADATTADLTVHREAAADRLEQVTEAMRTALEA